MDQARERHFHRTLILRGSIQAVHWMLRRCQQKDAEEFEAAQVNDRAH